MPPTAMALISEPSITFHPTDASIADNASITAIVSIELAFSPPTSAGRVNRKKPASIRASTVSCGNRRNCCASSPPADDRFKLGHSIKGPSCWRVSKHRHVREARGTSGVESRRSKVATGNRPGSGQLDLSTLSTSAKLKIGGGGLFFISAFLPWWRSGTLSLNMTDYFGTAGLAWLIFTAIAVASLMMETGKLKKDQPIPTAILLGAGLATLLVLWRFVSDGISFTNLSKGPGAYLGLLSAIIVTIGSLRAFKESGGDLNDLKDVNKLKSQFHLGGDNQPPAPPTTTAFPLRHRRRNRAGQVSVTSVPDAPSTTTPSLNSSSSARTPTKSGNTTSKSNSGMIGFAITSGTRTPSADSSVAVNVSSESTIFTSPVAVPVNSFPATNTDPSTVTPPGENDSLSSSPRARRNDDRSASVTVTLAATVPAVIVGSPLAASVIEKRSRCATPSTLVIFRPCCTSPSASNEAVGTRPSSARKINGKPDSFTVGSVDSSYRRCNAAAALRSTAGLTNHSPIATAVTKPVTTMTARATRKRRI